MSILTSIIVGVVLLVLMLAISCLGHQPGWRRRKRWKNDYTGPERRGKESTDISNLHKAGEKDPD